MPDLTVEDDNGVTRVVLGLIASLPDDYGLKVIAADGATTIIDGTSDVFKIVATGTLTTAGAGTGAAHANAVLATGINTIPTCLVWQEFNDLIFGAFAAGQQLSALVVSGAGAVAFLYEGWAELTATAGQTNVVVQTTATTAGVGGKAGGYRYYVMQEVAF